MSAKLQVEDILAGHTRQIRALVGALRAVVRSAAPTVSEHAYPGWKALGYRDPQSGYVCGIFPYEASVRLYFEHGAALPDPDGVLRGSTKQVRHIELRPGDRVPRASIEKLLHEALRFGAVR